MRDLLARFRERCHAIEAWLRGSLGLDLSSFGASVGVHVMLLVACALVGVAARQEAAKEFTSEIADTTLPDFEKFEVQDLDRLNEPPVLSAAGSSAPTLSAVAIEAGGPLDPIARNADGKGAIELAKFDVRRPGEIVMPSAPLLGQSVTIRGSGSEHVGDVEGAVDRIAIEILRKLEQGPTLVVWAFDASGSLRVERERLAKSIEQIYSHISDLDKGESMRVGALLTSVVAFGRDRKAMTPKPTSEVEAICSAIREVPLDESGYESTFGTVSTIVRNWGRFKNDEERAYRLMVIVVTDEVGDDEDRLDEAIATARQAKTPIYVLGSPAIFGKLEGRLPNPDAKTRRFYPTLPVRQGPESAMLEQIRLPFWYYGPQFEYLDAGFGPHSLSRLSSETGGIYFITRMGPSRVTFDPEGMREYSPDWVGRAQYEKAVARDPLRQAVLQAARITQLNLPGQPSLDFPAAEDAEFKEAMTRNQGIVAKIQYTVDEALVPITAAVKFRDRETSRRWQAHFDLIRGRLLAMKVRCYEFNTICARMKRDALKFQNPNSNAWRLVPIPQVQSGEKVAAAAIEAEKLLKRVVESHPGTPWAFLAQRELKDPFGFQWVETFVPPRPRQSDAPAAKKKAMEPNPGRPPEPPKL